ncbi:caspase family protein [Azospirillum sp. HJ39]|uniref:caspase family protein n=1 Tax=Azospirillum sp. HJ39 TaxID=3159496 RepID=UPI0035577B53
MVYVVKNLPGDGPQVHVLVIGVSAYPSLPRQHEAPVAGTFGLKRLSSPALSAHRFQQWIRKAGRTGQLPKPLGTLQVLLSPSARERAVEPDLAGWEDNATARDVIEAVNRWKDHAKEHPDGIALFYFAGHGIQRNRDDAVLICDDFGATPNISAHTLDFGNVIGGMAPENDADPIARSQVYFIDACRKLPSQILGFERINVGQAFLAPLGGRDNRKRPVFFGTVPDDVAYGFDGQVSDFTGALLLGLSKAAPRRGQNNEWPVTDIALNEFLGLHLAERWETTGQEYQLGGAGFSVPICHLRAPPDVSFKVSIAPDAAIDCTTITIQDPATHTPVWHKTVPTRPDHPYPVVLKAGIYELSAEPSLPDFARPQPAYESVDHLLRVWPVSLS